MENILYIFVFLKTFDQLFDRSALFGCNIFHIVRNTFEFGTNDFITGLFEMVLDIIILRELAIKYDFFLIGLHFIDTIVNHFKFEILHRDSLFGFDMKHTFVVEQERKTTGRSQRSSGFIEITAHICYCTGRIISSSLDNDSYTERPISLINNFLIISLIF